MKKPEVFAKFAKPRVYLISIVFDEDFADYFRLLFGDSLSPLSVVPPAAQEIKAAFKSVKAARMYARFFIDKFL